MINLWRKRYRVRVWSITHKGKKEVTVEGKLMNPQRNLHKIEHDGHTIYVEVTK